MKITNVIKDINSFPKKPKKNCVYLVGSENYTPYKYFGIKNKKQVWEKTCFNNQLDKQNGSYNLEITKTRNIKLRVSVSEKEIRNLFVGPHNKKVIEVSLFSDMYPVDSDHCFFVKLENKYYSYDESQKAFQRYLLPIIDAYKQVNNKLFRDLNNELFGEVKTRYLEKGKKSKPKIPNPKSFADDVTRSEKDEKPGYGYSDYFDEFNYGDQKTPIKRQICRHVYEKYYSAIMRKSKNNMAIKRVSKPKISHEVARMYDEYCYLDVDKNTITFKPHGNEHNCYTFEFDHITSNNSNLLKDYIKSGKYGGNLVVREGTVIFNFCFEFKEDWAFEPLDFIGYDLNKTDDSFLVFSKEILFNCKLVDVIRKSDIDPDIKKTEKNIEKNKDLLKKAKGGYRYKLNREIKLYRKKLVNLYEPIAKQIVNYLLENKICLCLDNVHCGATLGSFGQDNFQKILINLLEKSNCPFVICNTEYTSRMCYECKHVHDKMPTSIRNFNCSKCKKYAIRDKNAAQNIEHLGKQIWNQGIYKTVYDYKKKYGVDITKHSKIKKYSVVK